MSTDCVETDAAGNPTCFSGRGAVEIFRLAALASAIKFEIKCPGMRLMRGRKATTVARQDYGLKGNPAKLLAQVETLLAAQKELIPYVERGQP